MPRDLTLCLTALAVEAAPLLALMKAAGDLSRQGAASWRGGLAGTPVELRVTGAGREACHRALPAELDRLRPARVLQLGIAGALDPRLRVGDVVVARWKGGGGWPMPRSGGRGDTDQGPAPVGAAPRSRPAFRVLPGRIASRDEPVVEAALRRRLRDRLGADCVDMETEHVARICRRRGMPLLAVRGISDTAAEPSREGREVDVAKAVWHATVVAIESLAQARRHSPQTVAAEGGR